MTQRNALTLAPMALLLAAALSEAGFAHSDPLIGTWKLNLAKSTYSPGPPPNSDTMTFDAVEGGHRSTIETIDAQGNSSKRVP
jgi:hypothetical protein